MWFIGLIPNLNSGWWYLSMDQHFAQTYYHLKTTLFYERKRSICKEKTGKFPVSIFITIQ